MSNYSFKGTHSVNVLRKRASQSWFIEVVERSSIYLHINLRLPWTSVCCSYQKMWRLRSISLYIDVNIWNRSGFSIKPGALWLFPNRVQLRGPQGSNLTYQCCCRRQARKKAGSLQRKTVRARSRQSSMNRSHSSSRASGRSHCKHLQERGER